MAERMSPKERILAAVGGKPVDRPPVSFWGHAYHRESTAHDLAESTLEFWTAHQWDFVKLNPRASYHAETWGVEVRYPGVRYQKPQRVDFPVKTPADWARIGARAADAAPLAEQLEAIRLVRRGLPPDVLLIETVFSPLAIAADLAASPAAVLAHLRQDEGPVLAAVERIAATFQDFVRQALAAGADGIYFATVDWATRDLLTPAEYARYARPTDLAVLETAQGATFNVVHVCRRNNLLAELADYPAHAYSWAATEPGNPDLRDGLRAVGGAVAGGIGQEDALQAPGPFAVLQQLDKGFELTGGRRWIVAPGCSIPPTTPTENLNAIRRALDERAASPQASQRART
jgi:uroporphyrinogen decarboxylase